MALHFTQHYLECLSQASYLIGDTVTGNAVVVDPRRDVEEYLSEAAEHGLTIVGAINTHVHADFVSGDLELARATGCWVGLGESASVDYHVRSLRHHETIELGDVVLTILATPGHTPESISVLIHEHACDETPYGICTGDALFIGDVGRPDLLASTGVSPRELASTLYDTVNNIFLELPDATRVFPGHGAGSSCGKSLGAATSCTIGEQRHSNYALQPMSREQFINAVTDGQPLPPAYFPVNVAMNRTANRVVREPGATVMSLTAEDFDRARTAGAPVIDVRDQVSYNGGHIAGSFNVPSDGRMVEAVGMLCDITKPVLLVGDHGFEDEDALRLSRIGVDGLVGYLGDLEGYLTARPELVRHSSRCTVTELRERLNASGSPASAGAEPDWCLLDVRSPAEYEAGFVEGSVLIPLPQLVERCQELDPAQPTVIICRTGWRSAVAASALRAQGFADVIDVIGGITAWAALEEQSAVG